jgi:hypothetical protein
LKPVAAALRLSLIVSLSLGSACSQLLGIEEAHVDPTLVAAPVVSMGGSQSGSSGSSSVSTAGQHEEPGDAGNGSGGSHNHDSGGSDDSGGKAGGSATAGSGGTTPVELDLCERYCDQITRTCKGKYEQYRTFDQCVRVCKRLPPGKPGDEDTNTVSCRLRQAELSDSEPFVYCKSAGPLGEGKCGSNCVSYCSLMQEACSAESTAGNHEPSYYESSQACLTACAGLPATSDGSQHYSSSADAEPTSFVGNSVFCRTYHVAAALEQDTPDEHCPHAMGGDPCIDH